VSRIFSRVQSRIWSFGEPPHAYLVQQRLELATQLMFTSADSLATSHCGWDFPTKVYLARSLGRASARARQAGAVSAGSRRRYQALASVAPGRLVLATNQLDLQFSYPNGRGPWAPGNRLISIIAAFCCCSYARITIIDVMPIEAGNLSSGSRKTARYQLS
jgi:hypothetical protein